MATLELIATCAAGVEAVVARELKALGYDDQTMENGRVIFRAGAEAIPRANLWLRSAGRVLLKVGAFRAVTFDELFEQTKALPWVDWLPYDAEFPVSGKSVKSQLYSVSDCQAIVKKAIAEAMKIRYKCEWFPENGPRYPVEVSLLHDEALLTIDTSGSGLHKRGYRPLLGAAPLRETLAATMIQLSYWQPDRAFLDPFCGTGTLPIEAALIGCNIAPGSFRQFVSERWPVLPANIWPDARTEANDAVKSDVDLRIYGSDIDGKALSLARQHAQLAGVNHLVHFQKLAAENVRSRFKYGCIICNPPYGERMGDRQQSEQLYQRIGETFTNFDTWSIYIITSHPKFEQLFGRKADKRRKLYNGRIQTTYYQFFGPRPPR